MKDNIPPLITHCEFNLQRDVYEALGLMGELVRAKRQFTVAFEEDTLMISYPKVRAVTPPTIGEAA